MIIILVLSSLLFLKLGLVLLSVINNSLSDSLNSNIAVNFKFLENTHFFCDRVRVDVFVLFEDVVLVGIRVSNFRYVQGFNHIFGNLIVAADNHIVNVFAGEDHEDTLVQRKDWVVATLEIVHDIISPNSYIEEVSHGFRLLEGLNMTVVKQIKTTLNENHLVCSLGFFVITEMHNSSCSS